jgi:histidine ammonia-lyase
MDALRIGAAPLTPDAIAATVRGGGRIELSDLARERIAAGASAASAIAKRRPIYGRTTGVGANRHIETQSGAAHALRLVRSHGVATGEELPEEVLRATLLVRVNQIGAGGSGLRGAVADALVDAFNDGGLAGIRDLGQMGTGDLAVLGQIGVALSDSGRLEIEEGDALPLMSSNAATLGVAALAAADTRRLFDAALVVAALTFRAVDGNPEAFAEAIAEQRPLPGLAEVSARMRALTAGGPTPVRIQDPFGLRALPPVAGATLHALQALEQVITIEANGASENPLVDVLREDVFHHAGFHVAHLAVALDALRLALVPFAALSGARLGMLVEPGITGLLAFLAADVPGSSGVMMGEYVVADALARLRAQSSPAVTGGVVVSRGLEEHASFAWQGALQARRSVPLLRSILAVEWFAAERALRLKRVQPDGALAGVRRLADSFDPRVEDRPLGDDLMAAERLLEELPQHIS